MSILFNPVIAILVNTSTGRYHPIVYQEAPLPGPPSGDKPLRHKSFGHHTSGFATREEAVADAETKAKQVVENGLWPSCALALDPEQDVPWDGQAMPADVAFFAIEGNAARRLM